MASTSLGAELQQLSHLLEALIVKEQDLTHKKQLRAQLAGVFDSIQSLVDSNVDAATHEYQKARHSVEHANAKIIAALTDLSQVAAAIATVGKVVDTLGKLAPAAAAA